MSCCCCNLCCVIPRTKAHFCSKVVAKQRHLNSSMFDSPKCWMSHVSDDTRVSDINIPGTHDTMSNFSYLGLAVTVCQKWTLIQQLNAGIRFLDIRVKQDTNSLLPIHHGVSFQKTYLEADVLKVCSDFLKENPKEMLIIMIRIECRDKDSPSLAQAFDNIITRMDPELFSFESTVPTIGSLRGKIWIWTGDNWNYKGFPTRVRIRMGELIRQDEYEADIPRKKMVIAQTNEKALQLTEERKSGKVIILNQINAALWYKWPSVFAEELNAYVFAQSYVQGIICLDFPGEQLIKRIIESNFKSNDQSALIEIEMDKPNEVQQVQEAPGTVKVSDAVAAKLAELQKQQEMKK